jgi:hypothetical protein
MESGTVFFSELFQYDHFFPLAVRDWGLLVFMEIISVRDVQSRMQKLTGNRVLLGT